MWPFTNRLREATSCTTKLQSCQSLEISNLEIFFLRPAPSPPTEFANAAPSGKFHFWFGPLQAILREKRGSICQGLQLVECSSNQTLAYIFVGDRGAGAREKRGRERAGSGRAGGGNGYIWGLEAGAEIKKAIVSIVCWDPLNKKMNRKMNKNVKFWHSLKVKPGFLILLINLKGHKSTGGGRTW